MLFYGASAVAVVASFLAVTRSNALHALIWLVVGLFAVAVIFLALGGPFIAALEVIVYAGAIMVLILFVIMMLNQGERTVRQERRLLPPRAWIVPGLLTLILAGMTVGAVMASAGPPEPGAPIGPAAIGRQLFGPYLLAVELAAILLLAGLLGAYYLGGRQ